MGTVLAFATQFIVPLFCKIKLLFGSFCHTCYAQRCVTIIFEVFVLMFAYSLVPYACHKGPTLILRLAPKFPIDE